MIATISRNFGWKLAALSLSLLIWIILAADTPVETRFYAPVQYRNIPPNLEIGSDLLDRVQLEVRGPSERLTPFALQQVAVIVDLSSISRPGQRTIPLRDASILLPPSVTVKGFLPDQVRLAFEKRLSRDVPVAIRIASPPPLGFQLVSQSANPATLRIVGPESSVLSLAEVSVDPLDLSEVTSDTRFPAHAFTSDTRVRFESAASVTISVSVKPGRDRQGAVP